MDSQLTIQSKTIKHAMNLKVNAAPLPDEWIKRSALYRQHFAEREEILKHKWIESEKAGRDIGLESALVSWVVHCRAQWQRARRTQADSSVSFKADS